MERKASLALVGIGIAVVTLAVAALPSASAAPTPMSWDPSKIYDETFNNFTSALNVTANLTQTMTFNAECSQNDFDFIYVWSPGGEDLVVHVMPQPSPNATRFDGWIKGPEHFDLAHVQNIGLQSGTDFWLNTTTRLAGPYYFATSRCNFVDGLYDVIITASATGSVSDNNNYLAQATTITGGLTVSASVTESSDQMDLFRLDVSYIPPPAMYFQIQCAACGTTTPLIEFYNATGVAMDTPTPIYTPGGNTYGQISTRAFPLPPTGTFYLRIWSNGATNAYSISFAIFTYSPNKPTCLDMSTTCTVTDNSVVTGGTAALNFTFEPSHYYKIFLTENDTIWVNVSSTQIDIFARLFNQPADASPPQPKGFASTAFSGPEDQQQLSYRMNATELALTTGWYYIQVGLSGDLPPQGLYTLRVWLNDRPIALNRTALNPIATDEDVPVQLFDLSTLFYDNDCKLGDTADCTLRITEFGAEPADINFSFDGGHLVNISSTANWSGAGCRQYLGFDAKNNSTAATLCVSVAALNDQPLVLTAQTRRDMTEDQALVAVLIASWFDDPDGDTLTYSVSGNDNITVAIDQLTGLADFDPELDFNGPNTLTFTACDTNSSCVDWPIDFVVAPVNDAPTARGALPFMACNEDGATSLNLATVIILGEAGAFYDVDMNTLTYRVANVPAEINVTVLGPVITVTPAPDVAGIFFFDVRAWDGFAESFPAPLRITVTALNDAPSIDVWVPATNPTVSEGDPRDFQVTASDVDPDTTLLFQWYVDSVGQTNAVFANFTYRSEVTNDLARSVIIKVNVSDQDGGYAEHSWTLTIDNTNQPPTVDITAPALGQRTFNEGDTIAFSSVGADNDGDTLTYSWTSDRVFLPIGTEQQVSVVLAPGTHDIRVRVSDGHGGEDQANITVVVRESGGPSGGDPAGLIIGSVVAIAAVAGVAVFLMRRGKKAAP